MSIVRQGRHFVLVGIAQWLLDWGVLVLLSRLGVPIIAANIAARLSGALLGFSLNGLVTFSNEDVELGRPQLQRYAILWSANAAMSTLAVTGMKATFGLHAALIAKPLIDGLVAIGSFLAQRHWVYR